MTDDLRELLIACLFVVALFALALYADWIDGQLRPLQDDRRRALAVLDLPPDSGITMTHVASELRATWEPIPTTTEGIHAES